MKRGTRVFILKKALELLLTLLIVTMISFILMQLSPIDAAEAYARRNAFAITPESLATLREQMGLNDPLPVQYWNWVKDAVHLDFGTSYTNGRDVFQEVTQAFSITATIVLLTAVVQAPMHARIAAHTSSACSVVATLPVPMAQMGS